MTGLYPDCPGSPYYTLTTPTFDKITIHLDKRYYPGGDLVIETQRAENDARYIKSMTLGGKALKKFRISHEELIKGKTLRIYSGTR